MNILSWNCRGLGNPWTIRDLCQLTKEKNPSLVFLMETKLRRKKMELIRCKLGFKNLFVVDCVGKGGASLFCGRRR
jgi:exonuclease III